MHRSKTDKPYNDNNNNKPYYKQPEHPTPAPGWNVINGHGSNNNNQFYNKPTQKSGLIRYIRIKLFRVYFIPWRTKNKFSFK